MDKEMKNIIIKKIKELLDINFSEITIKVFSNGAFIDSTKVKGERA